MPLRKEIIGDATLYLGDSTKLWPTLAPADLVVTSPPYGQQRDYGKKIGDWRGLVSGALAPLADHGATQVLVNLGLIHRNGEVVPYWEPFIADMRAAGWRHFGWYVWDQGSGLPGDWNGRFAPSHEFILHFNRGSRRPRKLVPCAFAGVQKKSPMIREPNGEAKFKERTVQPFKIGDSVIRIGRSNRPSAHPAVFPVALPQELIASYTGEGETVLDPFMGSGTTGVACANLGRRFVGIEREPTYFDIACRRIEAAQNDMRMAA